MSLALLVSACSDDTDDESAAPAEPTVQRLSVATYNVDGLPVSFPLGEYGDVIKTMLPSFPMEIDDDNNLIINADGPGDEGSRMIGEMIREKGWDVFGLNEDFFYHESLWSSLGDYSSGGFAGITDISLETLFSKFLSQKPFFDVDGLLLGAKRQYRISNEVIRPWNADAVCGYLSNSQDSLTRKGFRYYSVDFDGHYAIDFIILHADAGDDNGDIAAREAALAQLYDFIVGEIASSNPLIVMGDFNCLYGRDRLEELFLDRLNAVDGLSVSDVWVEKHNGGHCPEYVNSRGEYDYVERDTETLDKIVYVNRGNAPIRLRLESASNLIHFVGKEGKPLADHYPLEATFVIERQ